MSDLTNELWEQFGTLRVADLPEDVTTVAQHCILDWFGCALAGSREPLVSLLLDEFGDASGPSGVVGTDRELDLYRSALINGAAGHALDFDDTSFVMGGHGTAPLLPAVLALTQSLGGSGADALVAYVVGMEVQARIGNAIGPEHYATGWHTTATMGVFGAAAACARLLGLDADQFGTAMGVAASGASGVKANFGTMTKPLHPGQAAERGVMAARLAARGWTANSEAVDGNQSLAQAAGNGSLDATRLERLRGTWATPRTMFKYHASCHLTHAGIEATSSLFGSELAVEDVEQVTLTVNPSILDVCGIPDPSTGLETKFSLRGTQALVLSAVDTAAVSSFTDDPINRPDVQKQFGKVEILTDDSLTTLMARVLVEADGQTHEAFHDTNLPATDLGAQGARLRQKFDALAAPIVGDSQAAALGNAIEDLAATSDVSELMLLTRP